MSEPAINPAEHVGLAWACAREYARRTRTDTREWFGLAYEQIVACSRSYNPALGAFSSYASFCIRNRFVHEYRTQQRHNLPIAMSGNVTVMHDANDHNRTGAPVYRQLRDALAREDPGDLERCELNDVVRREVDRLPERERLIVAEHARGRTYKDLGEMLGLSKERIRQIELGALAKLRAALAPYFESAHR